LRRCDYETAGSKLLALANGANDEMHKTPFACGTKADKHRNT